MRKYERENLLLHEIKSHNQLTNKEFYTIAQKNDIVNITARRDLSNFIKNGYVENKMGAIVWIGNNPIEQTRNEKKNHNITQKLAIGKFACNLLESNDAIFVSAGTTNEYFVKCININIKKLITNSIDVFMIAKNNTHIKSVNLIGGIYREQSGAFVGRDTIQILENHKFNKGFFTGTNIDENLDIYNNNEEESEIFNKALERSTMKIGLFDSEKFCNEGISFVAPITIFDQLITDCAIEKETIEKIKINVPLQIVNC